MNEPMWRPSAERVEKARMTAFLREARDRWQADIEDYTTLYRWSIEQTARLLMEIAGRDVKIVCEQERLRPENSEVNRLLADNRVIHELTGWAPAVPFRDGLRSTVEWIRINIDRFDPGRYVQ